MPVAVLVCCMLWASSPATIRPRQSHRSVSQPATLALVSPLARRQPIPRSTRANPFPKVTGPICRLPLPALFISDRGCSPWGPDAVIGTPRRGFYKQQSCPADGVSRAARCNWTPDNTRRSAKTHLFLPTSGFHRVRWICQTEKKSLPSASLTTSPPQRASPHLHPSAGISTCFPFAGD